MRAYAQRSDAITKAYQEYRAAVATTFQFTDRIEVFLLDFSMGKDPAFEPKEDDKVFEIRPDNGQSKVIKSAKVPTKDIPKWRDAAAKMCSSKREGAAFGCHFPIHGLRLYAGETLLLETSICWTCTNYQFDYGLGDSGWVALSADADDLKKLLDDLMPIPESEKRRFSGPKTNWKGSVF